MQIIHTNRQFFIRNLPAYKKSNKDLEVLKKEFINYYTFGPYKPIVSIDKKLAIIEIDTPTILDQVTDFRKVVSLCENKKFTDAKKLLKSLIEKNPTKFQIS